MRHARAGKKLGRDSAHRKALYSNLAGALIRHGRIEKGGESKQVDLVEKVFVDLAKRFKGRPGGYTRIIKLGPRRGDNAPMAFIEFVGDMPEAVTAEKAAAE